MFNPVTSLSIMAGAAPASGPTGNHIVVYDENANALPPTDITWALDASLVGVSTTADATGFFFTAPSATPSESGNAVATFTVNGVTGTLAVTVTVAAVTSLQFSQE